MRWLSYICWTLLAVVTTVGTARAGAPKGAEVVEGSWMPQRRANEQQNTAWRAHVRDSQRITEPPPRLPSANDTVLERQVVEPYQTPPRAKAKILRGRGRAVGRPARRRQLTVDNSGDAAVRDQTLSQSLRSDEAARLQSLREANQREANRQEAVREENQRQANSQEATREENQRQANSRERVREENQREENSRQRVREENARLEAQREENRREQVRQEQRREENRREQIRQEQQREEARREENRREQIRQEQRREENRREEVRQEQAREEARRLQH